MTRARREPAGTAAGHGRGGDGYRGPAMLEVTGLRLRVHVELRGYFQPIDGRYHWYGRIQRHEALLGALGGGRAGGVLTTPAGSAPCELSDPDLWQRYRISGISTPPYPTGSTPADAAAAAGPAEAKAAGGPEAEARPASRA